MQGRYLRHPFLCLSIYPVVEVSPQGYWKYPSLVAVVVAEERLGLLHIKQCVSKHEESSNGANPLRNPSLKNKKAVYNCASVATLPNDFPTGSLGKAKRMCKRPDCLLLATATRAL
jgi:hypothetical protein